MNMRRIQNLPSNTPSNTRNNTPVNTPPTRQQPTNPLDVRITRRQAGFENRGNNNPTEQVARALNFTLETEANNNLDPNFRNVRPRPNQDQNPS